MFLMKYVYWCFSVTLLVLGEESHTVYKLSDKSELLVLEFTNLDVSAITDFLNTSSVFGFEGTLVRGRWKDQSWGSAPISIRSAGSSMVLRHNNDPALWTRLGWMLSSLLGGAFESLVPGEAFPWIVPMDITPNLRVGSNPNEPCCVEQMDRFSKLLPHRGRGGLLTKIDSQLFASSQYVSLSLQGDLSVSATLMLHLANDSALGRPIQRERTLPTVGRSLIGSPTKPERIEGTLELVFRNPDLLNSVTITYYEQLPFFLIPLWSTYKGETPVIHADPLGECPTMFTLTVNLLPGEERAWSLRVAKKYLPTSKFSFSFEKGFDIGSAVWTTNGDEIEFTRGLVVVVPLPDATATFNMIAIASTAIAFFYGSVFRVFFSKRSLLINNVPQSVGLLETVIAAIRAGVVAIVGWVKKRNEAKI